MQQESNQKKCPARLNIKCESCFYTKQELCDYPYIGSVKIPIECEPPYESTEVANGY
jgi:hypothetical protein